MSSMLSNGIPFADLKAQYAALKDRIDARIQAVLDHGQYILGPEVEELETALAARVGASHCVTVASGTEALLVALMALGIGRGDEVVTTPFTFAATAEMIALLGATPVFADIDPATCNLDAEAVARKLSPRTKAIMPVSLYGQPADMAELNALAADHGGIPVIEDAAQSLGATYRGRHSGALSAVGCTSFFPSKPLGCYGDGGALFTDDDAIASACREIRVHGQSGRYLHSRIGVGGRMDTLQCAIVLAKLERFDWELERRRQLAARYEMLLREADASAAAVGCSPDRTSAVAQFTVRSAGRDELAALLKAACIPTAVHYPLPLNRQPAYQSFCCPDCCPEAARAAREVLSLPMSADLREADQERIVATLVASEATLGIGREFESLA